MFPPREFTHDVRAACLGRFRLTGIARSVRDSVFELPQGTARKIPLLQDRNELKQ